ncbi:CdaR family transcriptional regulator [Conexibacter sp. SYSU D00693]|uniref:PucR family transcriptional regulator n=1 Tax=Conexibacter sp. SYSU D00693 TaxID=2812560 RepID=UPI00196AF48A|nr:helix-turn-helix domain-containing protein [Conexibacter sp. SYSU D00693]
MSPRLADALRPVLPALAEETIAAIAEEVPQYARPMEGPFGRGVRMGVERALARFVEGRPDPASRELYVELGRGEQRAGRSLDALLAAYRTGARLAWERFSDAGQAAGVPADELFALAGQIFSYIDRISAESAEGFTAEASAAEADRRRRRRALLRVLMRDDAGPEEVRDLAHLAGWPRPQTVAGIALGSDDADRLAGRLGPDVLAVAEDDRSIGLVPDPDAPGREAQLRAVLGELPAVLGPTVALERAAASLARARLAFDVLAPEGGLVRADDHLVELLVRVDPTLAAALVERELAPLETVRASSRAKLEETLRAWLDEPGQITPVARRLGLHPQTVRYRVGQLRELFGERLDDPEARFALALALRARGG